jgi:hypothetical protein
MIADCSENQFTLHDFVWWKPYTMGGVQAVLEALDNTPLEQVRPCDKQKLIKSLKLWKACGIMVFQTNASGTFQDSHLYTSHVYLIPAFGYHIFQSFGRTQNIALLKTRQGPQITTFLPLDKPTVQYRQTFR